MIKIGFCKILKVFIYNEKSGQLCGYWAFREGWNTNRNCLNCRRCDLTMGQQLAEKKSHMRGGIRKRPQGYND